MLFRISAAFIMTSFAAESFGQERVTSPHSKGGTPLNQKWEGVPAEFRESLKFPDWPLPTNLQAWERDRVDVRGTLVKLMGNLPARPDPAKVRVVATEDRGEFTLEKIEFHNGADAIVPGYIMIPKSPAGAVRSIAASTAPPTTNARTSRPSCSTARCT